MELSGRSLSFLAWGVALALLAWTLLLIQRKRRWLRNALRATGRITHVDWQTKRELVSDSTRSGGMTEEDVTYGYPHVEFTAEDGTSVRFRSSHGYERSRATTLPSSVTVLYERVAPQQTAQLEEGGALWGNISALALVTLLALGFAVVTLFAD
jgi:hypothetical protein